ncbi:MAG: thioredoxin-dependent thiol peroxidase [Rhodospirillales bacterium]|nr:thioredoxin-dependent thiol peroxidase [Rhodospirillales bacterium]
MTCNVGDKAPAFKCPTDGGGSLSLKDLKGTKAVLYFYPKDMTPGCTKEAEDFRDMHRKFKSAKTLVIGISKDPPARHDKFREKYKLPFPLISDEDGAMCEAYGVWVEKSLYGRKYMGIERATFLIDEKGKIREVWRKVKVKGHAEAVLKAIKAL